MPSAHWDTANGVTPRLRTALASRDRAAASALRSALAAIGNAEAVGVAGDDGPTTSAHFARARSGVGSAEVPRRALSEADIGRIVGAEIDRRAAAHQYDELGRGDVAIRLRHEAGVRLRLPAACPAVSLRAAAENPVYSGADAAVLGH